MAASPLRSIISGSIGNLVEWYDWYVTGCALLSLLVYWRMGESRARGHLEAGVALGPW